jgi:fructosamine-3-kinase
MTCDFRVISAGLAATLGIRVAAEPSGAVGGGSVNACFRWQSDTGPLFVKLAASIADAGLNAAQGFEAETDGLEALRACGALRVPRVLGRGATATHAFLALEYVEFVPASAAAEIAMGLGLARQHRHSAASFGWHLDNRIGRTPQRNTPSADWVAFLRECRLGPQLALAARNGHGGRLERRGTRLLECLEQFFASYTPFPALVHGDLWGGNWGATAEGEPVIYDPAVHFADRESDIAMTRLFGGFGAAFYAAYAGEWPLDAGAPVRGELYSLYHVLNHLNLFGGGYAGQAQRLIDTLLAELGA